MRELSREEVITLLERWGRAECTAQEVHEEAERLLEGAGWPEYPRRDPRSIQLEILSQLEILNHQFITPEDIPAMKEFLATAEGQEDRGWEVWRRYWNGLNMKERRLALKGHPYYRPKDA